MLLGEGLKPNMQLEKGVAASLITASLASELVVLSVARLILTGLRRAR